MADSTLPDEPEDSRSIAELARDVVTQIATTMVTMGIPCPTCGIAGYHHPCDLRFLAIRAEDEIQAEKASRDA